MRIIAGRFRSRKLVAPKGTQTRPTTDRARETLFNVLANRVTLEGMHVLDLFSGSGAFALEAISRGAGRATLVDKDRNAALAARENIAALGLTEEARVVQQDVFAFLRSAASASFDLIFADAPYRDARARDELPQIVAERELLPPGGLLIIEHSSSDTAIVPAAFEKLRELKAGEAAFTIMRRPKPEGAEAIPSAAEAT